MYVCMYARVYTCVYGYELTKGKCACMYVYVYFSGGACGVMVIVVGNGHGDTSSNPGRR